MLLTFYTLLHVAISLVGIVTGFLVLSGMLAGRRTDGWTPIFLWTTVATSVTGFGFPVDRLLPSHIVGILSLIVLAMAFYAKNARRLAGPWRSIYAVTALVALYFNVFVLVVQLFQRVPPLHALAPTGSEPPFGIAQGLVLVAFVAVGILAVKRFRPV
jgi:hypothetical protein